MDIVVIIAFVTGFAGIEVLSALLYRGWELSRGDVPEHVRVHHTMRTYAEHAEDNIDHMFGALKESMFSVWASRIIPTGAHMKKRMICGAQQFTPTAYILRVYNAIRGLHSVQGEGEKASSFLQEVHAHKRISEAQQTQFCGAEETKGRKTSSGRRDNAGMPM